ncbi:ATP-dependent DNA ligase [Propionibacteriaceae bacterium Y2011]|uniref:ATP-dependent DNA ligase n=1 Tax=Microlunatus sp. Y2014 TaxID=3418488 RepID=UPI003B4FDABD
MITPPVLPMLAQSVDAIPAGMAYEPKWDGWRCIVFTGDRPRLFSRRGTELTGDFPELVNAVRDQLPPDSVLDGEIVIISNDRLDYTALASRHGAGAKADRLSRELPAHFIAFDVLQVGGRDIRDQQQRVRRRLLEELAGDLAHPLLISPLTTDVATAKRWFVDFEDFGLDGVMAKPPHGTYQSGKRTLFKIKHRRTADVVVGGFRLDRNATPKHPTLGSLQLGLYRDGLLHHLGVCAGFPQATRVELGRMLLDLEVPPGSTALKEHPWHPGGSGGNRIPDGVSRWSTPNDRIHLIDPLLVCEVTYDAVHPEGDLLRFRSNTAFLRWRTDKVAEDCTVDQLDQPSTASITSWLDDHQLG